MKAKHLKRKISEKVGRAMGLDESNMRKRDAKSKRKLEEKQMITEKPVQSFDTDG